MRPSLVGRLMLAYTVVLAAVLLSAWWSERSFSAVEDAAERLSRRSVEGMQLMERSTASCANGATSEQKLLLGESNARTVFEPQPSSFESWLAEMEEFAHSPKERELLEQMRASYHSFAAEAAAIGTLQQAGRTDEARLAFKRLEAAVERLLADSETLFQSTEHDMRDRQHRAEATVDGARRLVFWTTAIGGLCSLVLGFILTRHAARPIVRLVLRLGASGAVDRVEFDGDEIGTLERHVGSLLDRVRHQERALQQAEKLSELGEIASEIAHETLNPVAGVKAMLQALRRTSLPADKLVAELANVERQLTRVEEIVRRLVRYARPLEPNMRRTPVTQIIERAVAAARLAPGACDRRIEIVGPQPSCEWVMDPDLVEQVLVNLLVNGCEASPPGSSVELGTKVENGQICFSVRDHGGGLGKVDRDRLFHPFYTTKPRGNGLGLAISRNIAREHGGQIEAISFDGVGERVPSASSGKGCRLRRTVLIVDDEELIRRSLELALTEAGYSVVLAASGREALDCLALESPDCLVLDLRLGDLPGFEVLRHARSRFPDLKTIVITAHGDVESAVARPPARGVRLHQEAVRPRRGHRFGQQRRAHRCARAPGRVPVRPRRASA